MPNTRLLCSYPVAFVLLLFQPQCPPGLEPDPDPDDLWEDFQEIDSEGVPLEINASLAEGALNVLAVNDHPDGRNLVFYHCEGIESPDEMKCDQSDLIRGSNVRSTGLDCSGGGGCLIWAVDGTDALVWDSDADGAPGAPVKIADTAVSIHCDSNDVAGQTICGTYESREYTFWNPTEEGWDKWGAFSGLTTDVLWEFEDGVPKNNFRVDDFGNVWFMHVRVYQNVSYLNVSEFAPPGEVVGHWTIDLLRTPREPNNLYMTDLFYDQNGVWGAYSDYRLGETSVFRLEPGEPFRRTTVVKYSEPAGVVPQVQLIPDGGGGMICLHPDETFQDIQATWLSGRTDQCRTYTLNVLGDGYPGPPVQVPVFDGAHNPGASLSAPNGYLFYSGGSLDMVPFSIFPSSLNFAQFADGGGLFSEIVLTNPDPENQVAARLEFRSPGGGLLDFDVEEDLITLPGNELTGLLDLSIPPSGKRTLRTDSGGDVSVGTVLVRARSFLSGVIVFGGSVGLAGVGDSAPLSNGFSAPMEEVTSGEIHTGVAVMNLEDHEVELTLDLFDSDGNPVAQAVKGLSPKGQAALFIFQFEWDAAVDFSKFSGLVKVKADGRISATVIQTRGGNQFATMPVTPL